jgi:CP family cyanate transporter-like MFS transporter
VTSLAPDTSRRHQALLTLALIATGLSMRTAVTSVGTVLPDVERGLHVSDSFGGVITTLPVVCFAVIGTAAPALGRRIGAHRLLVLALLAMTAGLVLRVLAHSIWVFLLCSVLALSGGAISNVLMPSLVKRHFPDRLGPMTAVYTTSLAVGLTAAAGLTVPIGDLGDGWRLGLGSWAALSAVAVLPWLPLLRSDRGERAGPRLPLRRLTHSTTAWALALFFAAQSFQAYVAFGWFATFLRDRGISEGESGALVAFLAAVTIPASMVLPSLATRGWAWRCIVVLTGLYVVAYVGLLTAPVGGAWLWMLLSGLGSGMFPLCLTLIGLRSRSSEATAALSAFAQGIGYVLAGTGPLLVGVLLGPDHNWTWPFVCLFTVLAIVLVAGRRACRPVYVDDELR